MVASSLSTSSFRLSPYEVAATAIYHIIDRCMSASPFAVPLAVRCLIIQYLWYWCADYFLSPYPLARETAVLCVPSGSLATFPTGSQFARRSA